MYYHVGTRDCKNIQANNPGDILQLYVLKYTECYILVIDLYESSSLITKKADRIKYSLQETSKLRGMT